jgi:uncharacterized protein YegL
MFLVDKQVRKTGENAEVYWLTPIFLFLDVRSWMSGECSDEEESRECMAEGWDGP